MDFSAFSHGQIQSKLWLCEQLEHFIKKPSTVAIVGSWYNILGFMLLSRNNNFYNHIDGYDCNQHAVEMSNIINDAWMINQNQKIYNFNKFAHEINFKNYDVIISTSVEDIENNWFDNVPNGKLVCLQSINIMPEIEKKYPNWVIKNYIPNMETFKQRFSLKNILFEGIQTYDYTHLKYDRYMLIGFK